MRNTIKKIILGILLILSVYCVLLLLPVSPNSDKAVFISKSTRIAHRCGRELYPENTLFACKQITEQGWVDFLEMDFHLTQDDIAVVIHDDRIERTTNGSGRILDYTFDELQKFDAGFHFSTDGHKTYPYRDKGIRIDKLETFFQTFPKMRFIIEVKPNDTKAADLLLDLIQKYNMQDQVVIGSFHQSIKDYLHEKNPALGYYASTKEVIIWVLLGKIGLSHLYQMPSDSLAVPMRKSILEVDEAFVQSARKQNLKILVWTINEEVDMIKLLKLGVDGIMTDNPKLLNSVSENLENRSPSN